MLLKIIVHPDKKIAPRYTDATKRLELKEAIITEMGMESDLPLVDLKLTDSDGNEYFAMVSGGLLNGLSASIKGVNLKNHGAEEP